MTALRLEDLSTAGRWLPLALDPGFATAYATATGWPQRRAAAGWSVVAARIGLTRGGRAFPPGGVLLGLTVTCLGSPPEDGRWEYHTATTVSPTRSGRRRLTATVSLRAAGSGAAVAEVTFVLLWPEES